MSSGYPPGGAQNPPNDFTQPAGRLPIRLRMQVGSSVGQVYTMMGDLLTIGRAQDNDVMLDDPQVSRYHAHLMRHGDEIIIEDLGSTNGTLVNGRRISGPHVLQPSETIAVGASVFSVEGFAAPSTVGMLPQTLTARDFPSPAYQSPAAAPQPAAQAAPPAGETPWQAIGWVAGLLIVVMLILALAGLTAWLLTRNGAQTPASIPSVFIQTPVTGSQVPANQPVIVNATASDPNGVTRAELWVGGNVVDQQQSAAAEGQPTFPVSLRWTPTVAGNYTLEVRAYNRLDASSAPTTVMITVVAAQAAATPTATPPAATATPIGPPSALTTADLNVREGPGQNYPVVALVTAGTELVVTGKSPDGVWWQVVYPPNTGGRGWIYAPFTRPSNTEAVPPVETPVPPTPTATPPDTPTVTPPPTSTPKPASTATPTPNQGPIVEFSATQTTINSGACTTLQWHIERVQAAYLNGGEFSNMGVVGPFASRDVCPANTTTYVLHADTTSGAIERSVTVTVQGSGTERTVVLNASTSGTVREDGRVSTSGGSVGDDSSNRGLRGFVAFDLSGLSGTDIIRARLDLSDYSKHGHPFDGLDSLVVEDVNWGSSLDGGDYDRSASATLKTINDEGGLDDALDVTGRVADRLDEGQRTFRIRLRFEKNSNDDNTEDRINWNSARLTIRYR